MYRQRREEEGTTDASGSWDLIRQGLPQSDPSKYRLRDRHCFVDDRMVDGRQPEPNELGSRGGRLAENSPLNSENSLKDVLTTRMQNSLTQLGFGAASPLEPLKLQLSVKEFSYGCNDGMMVNDCSVRMRFELTVIDGATTFTKPYGANESRRVATAPVKEYNEKWVNEVLDRLWQYMFNDDELRAALGVQ